MQNGYAQLFSGVVNQFVGLGDNLLPVTGCQIDYMRLNTIQHPVKAGLYPFVKLIHNNHRGLIGPELLDGMIFARYGVDVLANPGPEERLWLPAAIAPEVGGSVSESILLDPESDFRLLLLRDFIPNFFNSHLHQNNVCSIIVWPSSM